MITALQAREGMPSSISKQEHIKRVLNHIEDLIRESYKKDKCCIVYDVDKDISKEVVAVLEDSEYRIVENCLYNGKVIRLSISW